MKAQARLLCQFHWESVDALTAEEISRNVIPCLLTMAGSLGQASGIDAEAGSDLEDLATLITKARHDSIFALLSRKDLGCSYFQT